MTVHRQVRGKQAELFVFQQLLQRDLVPYTPTADVEGIDAVVKTKKDTYLGLQIKAAGAAGGKNPQWFQVERVVPKDDLFFLCVEADEGTFIHVWIFPSKVFDKVATKPPKGTPRDLDLEVGAKKYGQPLKEILVVFRDNWDLLISYEKYKPFLKNLDDLEDVFAMAEALAAPEGEASAVEAYLANREGHVSRQTT